MKTAIWTYNDIKQEDVNDLQISRNEKGELEMEFRKVTKTPNRANRQKKQMIQTIVYGSIIAAIVLAFVGFGSWVNHIQSESLDRAIERIEAEQNYNVAHDYDMEVMSYIESQKDATVEVGTANYVAVFTEKVEDAEIEEETAVGTSDKKYYVPPYVDTSFKAYMDYHTITDTTSKQYEMQQGAWTGMDGVRRIGDDICVAMGTYYAKECGERFEITLDTGKTFTVIVSDIKDDKDTDETNRYTLHGEDQRACIIEFIVDVDELGDRSRENGDVSYSNFKGEVVSVVKL